MNKLKWLLLILLATVLSANAQNGNPDKWTDISRIRFVVPIMDLVRNAFAADSNWEHHPESVRFSNGVIYKKTIPNDLVTKKCLLEFRAFNSADTTVSVLFFPGFCYRDIRLFRRNGDSVVQLPRILPPNPDSIGFREFSLAGHDSAVIIAELTFLKTYINTIRPRLLNNDFEDSFMADLHDSHNLSDLITFVLCGLLLMMVLYSLANFFQGANTEFFYYSGYAFFLGIMLFAKAIYNFHASDTSFFIEAYLDFIMQNAGIMFYMIFMRRFLEAKTKYRFLDKLYHYGIIMLILSSIGYSYFHYFTNNFVVENLIEVCTKFLLLFMVVGFLIYASRRWDDRLLRYLFWGNLFYMIFSVFSLWLTVDSNLFGLTGIWRNSLFYYETGLFLELVFFLAALNQKNKTNIIMQTRERERLKAENQLKEYEKEIAVYKAQQQERERISADMHDELGSGMTAIRLMSEIARNKMKENTPVEIEKISHSANDVLNKMNAIIWSMNSGNDSLDNLISYIRSYALEYFENTPVECKVITPDTIPHIELAGDKRRNVFLSVKESLNNVLKHSKGSHVQIRIETGDQLYIRIQDNGAGIDMQNLRQFGNGLKNIAKRMESIGGSFDIRNENGTVTELRLPFTQGENTAASLA